jgi:hypothetical protein
VETSFKTSLLKPKSGVKENNPITGLEGSRRLRLPDFKKIGT